jgi:iron complex outermembrane receptor protein
VAGHSLLGRWQQRLAGGSEYALQLSYGEEETVRTLDAEFQHRLAEVAGHKALWGLGYRRAVDQLDELGAGFLRLEFDPQRRTSERYGFFLQDELALWPDTLSLLLGTKIEHNSYTGIEIQPNARLLLTPWSDHTLWAAVARAVRTPSRAERDVRFEQSLEPTSGMPLGVARFVGNEDFDSEALIAYEAGYRWQAARNFSTDLALFLNDYRELRTIEAGRPQVETASGAPRLVLPVTPGNGMEGQTWGAELLLDYRPLERWRLQASYTFLEMDLATAPGSIDRSTPEATEGQSPRHQASLRSLLNLPHALELDAWLRLVDELPAAAVERYLTLDLRLGWRPLKGVELSLVGQNLLDRSHPEFEQDLYRTARSEVERSVYGKLSFSF